MEKIENVFIGAEGVACPLGLGTNALWNNILNEKISLKKIESIGAQKEALILSKMDQNQKEKLAEYKDEPFYNGLFYAIDETLSKIDSSKINSNRILILFSTTKGQISKIDENYPDFGLLKKKVKAKLGLDSDFVIISNACVSGVSAVITAFDFIKMGTYDHAFVIGGDEISDFTNFGFQSFFALSEEACKPYDANRSGINLGEAYTSIFLSLDREVFKEKSAIIKGGSVANDANHISGPSRTGEGLYRSVVKTFAVSNLHSDKIDFISAHGTATEYNDEMESKAFSRLNCSEVPLSSLKGYFGHTLGAAGVLEIIVSNLSLHENTLVKSMGYQNSGTTEKLNIIERFEQADLNTYLKTASGFGGTNASIIIQK